MKRGVRGRGWWLAMGLAARLCWAAEAQQYTPPPPELTTLPPCPQGPENAERAKRLAKKGECDPTNVPQPQLQSPAASPASEAFPFPGEAKPAQTPAAQAFPFPGSDSTASPAAGSPAAGSPAAGSPAAGSPAAGSPAAGSTPNTPAAKQYPYPGSDSAGGMPGEDGKAPAPAGSSSSSSSGAGSPQDDASSSSSSSSDSHDSSNAAPDAAPDATSGQPKLTDKGSHGSHGRKGHHAQTDSDRVDEDLSVSHFYLQSGNPMGAYLRAQDAVKTQPDYAVGHYALGEAAAKLGHRDEAEAEFKQYLKLDPGGEKAKDAEKELAKLH